MPRRFTLPAWRRDFPAGKAEGPAWLAVGLSCMAGALLAVYLYGGMIDPREVSWLLRENDSLQHYLGWQFFRRDAWQWPLGSMGNLASSLGASVVYTDSVPLLALALKPFHAWLPDPLQYLGLFMLANLTLNAGVGCALLQRSGLGPMAALAGSLLMASLPMAIMRGLGAHGHEALSAHWLLLLGIWLSLYAPAPDTRAGWRWLLLLSAAVLIHFYLFFMLGVMWAAWWCGSAWRTRAWRGRAQRRAALLWLVLTPAMVAAVMWGAGYFGYGGGEGGGYGVFSAEVLTYFNPRSEAWFLQHGETESLSAFFAGWATPVWGQYEGQAYAGLGGIGVLLLGAYVLMFRRQWPAQKEQGQAQGRCPPGMGWLLAATAGMFVFSLSDRVVLGSWLFELDYARWAGPLAEVLRSGGRLAWPLLYVLLLGALVLLAGRWPGRRLGWLLAGLVLVQLLDLKDWYASVHRHLDVRMAVAAEEPEPYAVLQDKTLEPLWQSRERILALLPENIAVLRPYVWLAAANGMSINIAHLARASHATLVEAARPVKEQLLDGRLDQRAVYLVSDAELAALVCRRPRVRCREHAAITLVWLAPGAGAPRQDPLSSTLSLQEISYHDRAE